jgi:dolichyl-phosphate-mannose-protein mannosyltransferase
MRADLRSTLTRPEFLLLTALALVTRFWGLFDPRVVVWDEIHFERFAGAYFTGAYYIDVHPPLGKLLLAGAARLLGVSGAALAAHTPTPELRVLPALAGALIIPVIYLLLRELGTGRRVATLAAAFLLADNALLVESRFILMDSMLILFGMAAVLFYLMARNRDGASRWTLLAAAAAAAGAAAAVKWTGLSALGLILLAWSAEGLARRRDWRALCREAAVLACVPAAIYVASFAAHFALLKKTGPGDLWMSRQFQATLAGNPLYEAGAGGSFVQSMVELNRTMGSINIAWASDTNAAASPWYTWPIAKHPVGFWSLVEPDAGTERWIVLFGNPIVWWGALFGVAALVAAVIARRGELARHRIALLFLTAGYAFNFIPFAFIKRPMFLYHYFFALIFSVMLAATGVGALAGWTDTRDESRWSFSSRRSRALYAAVIGVATVAFLYFAPMSYGRPLSAAGVLHRRWLLERHGG